MGLALRREMREETMREADDSQIVIPLLAEEVSVAKRQIVTGRVEVATLCREREELVDELLRHEEVEIERKPVGKTVEQAPRIREEGDTIIIPVVEEVLIVLQHETADPSALASHADVDAHTELFAAAAADLIG